MLEIEILDILRRKRFIYCEVLGIFKIVGRVGGEILRGVFRNDFLEGFY